MQEYTFLLNPGPGIIDWINATVGVVVMTCAILGVWISWRGVNTWRNELGARTRLEVAQKLLAATHALSDGITAVRRMDKPRLMNNTSYGEIINMESLEHWMSYLEQVVENFSKFHAVVKEAKVVLGNKAVEASADSIALLVEEWEREYRFYIDSAKQGQSADDKTKYIVDIPPGDDEYGQKLKRGVDEVGDSIAPYLMRSLPNKDLYAKALNLLKILMGKVKK